MCCLHSRPTYRYSQLSQDDEDTLGDESTFKYNPRPKGLRAYRDFDSSDDVSVPTYEWFSIFSCRIFKVHVQTRSVSSPSAKFETEVETGRVVEISMSW